MTFDDNNMSTFFEQLAENIEKNPIQKENIKNLKNLPLNKDESIYLFDFSQNKLIFHKGFQKFLGYDDNDISIDFIESLYHPDDAELTNRIIKASILYSLAYPEDSNNNTLSISFRLRKKDGNYIKILSRSYVYTSDTKSRITSVLIRFTDISFIDNSKIVKWDFTASNLNEASFKQLIYKTSRKKLQIDKLISLFKLDL